MKSLRRYLVIALSVALGFYGARMLRSVYAQRTSVTTKLRNDPAHPDATSKWVDTRLYFGLGPADAPDKGVSNAAWRDSLDKEVTSRFPDGLSVIDVYGQWQGKEQNAPERVRTRLLIIDYPDTTDNRNKIEAIRMAWKQKTGDLSVLKVTHPADISF